MVGSLVIRPISSFSILHAEKQEGLICKITQDTSCRTLVCAMALVRIWSILEYYRFNQHIFNRLHCCYGIK